MSEISELIEKLGKYAQYSNRTHQIWSEEMGETLKKLSEKLRTVNEYDGWIPCEERLPEERDSNLYKWYGESRWDEATMWRKQSDEVLVTIKFKDGTKKIEKMRTYDGKFHYDMYDVEFIAWRPLPEPYGEVRDEAD